MPKKVALILLNWNTPVHTANCICSLQKHCNEALFDIIVADNGSTDGSMAILKSKFPDLIYIENKQNLGFAEGNNRGLVYSIANGYCYSLVINTDTLVDEDIVTLLSNHLDHHPQAAAAQPAIYWLHDSGKIWNGTGKFNAVLGITKSETSLPGPKAIGFFENAEWLTGCCMMLKNDALFKSGLFNKQFFLYFEDVELSFRLREKGYQLHYVPSVKMYHEAGVSAKVASKKNEGILSPIIHYYISRNHIWFLRRYGKPVFYPVNILYNGAYYLLLLLYFTVRRRKEKAGYLIKGLREGVLTPKRLIWPENN